MYVNVLGKLYTFKILWMIPPPPWKSLDGIPFSDSHLLFFQLCCSSTPTAAIPQCHGDLQSMAPHALSISSPILISFLVQPNVMVHHYHHSLANALNSLAPLFFLPIWLANTQRWLNPTIPFPWTLFGENHLHSAADLYNFKFLISNFRWAQAQPRNSLIFPSCCWVKILHPVALIWKKKKWLIYFL